MSISPSRLHDRFRFRSASDAARTEASASGLTTRNVRLDGLFGADVHRQTLLRLHRDGPPLMTGKTPMERLCGSGLITGDGRTRITHWRSIDHRHSSFTLLLATLDVIAGAEHRPPPPTRNLRPAVSSADEARTSVPGVDQGDPYARRGGGALDREIIVDIAAHWYARAVACRAGSM